MVAIVGAGISGLVLAHALREKGVEHIVLETAAAPGGVICSGRVDGHLLEWGPQRTRMVDCVRDLVASVGIGDEVIRAPADLPLFVYRDGRLRRAPMSFRDLWSTDLIGAAGKLRVLAEPLTPAARSDESVAAYFTRKIGREAYANYAGPLYGGLFASDPADMVVGLSLANTLRDAGVKRSLLMRALRRRSGGTPAAISFKDGMQTLPQALYRANAQNVRLSCTVRSMWRDGLGYVLELRNTGANASRLVADDTVSAASQSSPAASASSPAATSADVIRADHVVFTGSAAATASLLRPVAPEAAPRIEQLRYNPLAIVHLYSEDSVERGFGYQVGFDETLVTRGVTFNDAMFDRTGVFTAYLGGARHARIVDWDDARVAETAVSEFKTVTGASARVLSVSRAWMPAWDRSWSAVSGMHLPSGLHVCANWESRPGVPGRVMRAQRLAALF